MAEQPMSRNLHESSSISPPLTRQTMRFLTAAMIGLSLLVLSGLTLTETMIGLIIATPLMVLFSPVLVPAVITIGVLTAGFLFSADKVDYAKMKISEKAKELGHYAQSQTHQTTSN
ncbi:hypothetical protein EUTSA_v10002154mg [Eutrema salsugineum]|uniref:Oleosin n=1 Tax=Eutrema salsugineum TaxID=72664 RepID=V4NU66_EUTSA|nr:hypothetical protein EUTSA_v10002154mg [Eutrema salsugineum]